MSPQQHVAKAGRILTAMRKLSTGDHEMVIEATMLAGTHLLNAVLHRESITTAEQDVLHAEYMTVALRTRTQLQLPGLVESLDAIEQLRPYHVRGNVAGGVGAAQAALRSLQRIREIAGYDAGTGPHLV